MTEIMVMETNKSGEQIAQVKPFIKDFGFTGCGHLIYKVTNKNTLKVKHLLKNEIVNIKSL